jgi:cyclic beta-1,2-glucan synthetase
MGSGDWNDGMNRVGREGAGESVWMGFFLHRVLGDMLPLCDLRGDHARAARYREFRDQLAGALETAGWDGAWYRRAYFDDGTALGSRESEECRIDAIVQGWAVMSGAAPADRAREALESAERHLVDRHHRLIRLLTPPFDTWDKDPGYIKGYLPGVRENGGQYTHGVLWLVRAWAELGEPDRALDLLTLLAPSTHATDRAAVERYKVEPYVAAADVYSEPPHAGRGGWTWYTGAAGWMWRVGLESLLGFRLEAGDIRLRPALPTSWPRCEIDYRPDADTVYRIRIEAAEAPAPTSASLDGRPLDVRDGSVTVPVERDGQSHTVIVRVVAGPAEPRDPAARRTSTEDVEIAQQPPEEEKDENGG